MDLHPPDIGEVPLATPAWKAVPSPTHQGALDGATLTGEASRRQLSVTVGLWLDETGWVRRARWRADDGSALGSYAEAACSLLEAGLDPRRLDGDALRSSVPDGTPADPDPADLVAAAIDTALMARGPVLAD